MATTDPSFYFEYLYPFQDEVLRIVATLDTSLYLTGGTAASRGYLHHRFSDDLDFFTNDSPQFSLWTDRVVNALFEHFGDQIEVSQREHRFVRLSIMRRDLVLKLEFVNDVPSHFGTVFENTPLGRLDNPENILANKITALFGREEPKDLADVWGFCCAMGLSLDAAIENAASKAAGVFPADLARILCSVSVQDWALIRWSNAPAAERFVADLARLGEHLLLSS